MVKNGRNPRVVTWYSGYGKQRVYESSQDAERRRLGTIFVCVLEAVPRLIT